MKLAALLCTVFFVSCSVSHAQNAELKISSDDIEPNSTISNDHVFDGFGCSGKNIFPQISWDHVPQGTKSFALTVYDPDAPTGSGWWHYVAVDIPVGYQSLPRGFATENKFQTSEGIKQVRNDYGMFKFGGPCPPKAHKPHRYIFTIFALDTEKLDVTGGSTAALAGFLMNYHALGKASFTAKYGR